VLLRQEWCVPTIAVILDRTCHIYVVCWQYEGDRLISLLLLLQSGQRRTARTLAEALEVSERTIYRDVDASAAGVPFMRTGAQPAESRFRTAIARADAFYRRRDPFALRLRRESDGRPRLDGGRDRALEKLHGGLADVQRRAPTSALAHSPRPARWYQGEPPRALLTALRRAVWDDRRVRLGYEDRKRNVTTRVVDPSAGFEGGVWYVVARSAGEMRSFRADRITEAEELLERFDRPADFDLERYWSETTRSFRTRAARLFATLRMTPETLEFVASRWSAEIDVLERGERILARVAFPSMDVACIRRLRGRRVTIVAPEDLRSAIVERAREAIAHYAPRFEASTAGALRMPAVATGALCRLPALNVAILVRVGTRHVQSFPRKFPRGFSRARCAIVLMTRDRAPCERSRIVIFRNAIS